jgi:hypothetical protein
MNAILNLIQSHGTRLLGIAQGTVALICGMTGLIPDTHLKYWLAASAILTYWRGQANAGQIAAPAPLPPFVAPPKEIK